MNRKQAGRIAKGFAKDFLGYNEEFRQDRLEICKACPFLDKEAMQCKSCGCYVNKKTQVLEEHCPENKWNDTMVDKKQGIAIINLSPEIADLKKDNSSDGFVMEFKENQKMKEPTVVEVMVVNERSNYVSNKTQLNLHDLKIKPQCGCSLVTDYPKKLNNKDYFKVKLEYKNKRLGGFKKGFEITADYGQKAGQSIYTVIYLKGKVL